METPVTFRNKKGMQLVGMLHVPENSTTNKTVIMCHGFGGHKTHKFFVDIARHLCAAGFYVLRFDFTGHGDSEGTDLDYSIKNEVDDLDSAVLFLKSQNINTDNIGLLGHSLGAFISVLYAKINKNIKNLVLFAPAINQKELIRLRYSKEQISELKLNGQINTEKQIITKEFFDEVKSIDLTGDISKLKIPVFVIQGKKDETVPVMYIKPLLEQITDTLNVEIYDDTDHDFKELNIRESIKYKTTDWFLKWLN